VPLAIEPLHPMYAADRACVNTLDQALKNPDFWAARLATLDYRGTDLTELMRGKADYEQMQSAAVRDAFARYFVPAAKMRFVVIPAPRP